MGGLKDGLLSSWSLGKWSNLTSIFQMGWNMLKRPPPNSSFGTQFNLKVIYPNSVAKRWMESFAWVFLASEHFLVVTSTLRRLCIHVCVTLCFASAILYSWLEDNSQWKLSIGFRRWSPSRWMKPPEISTDVSNKQSEIYRNKHLSTLNQNLIKVRRKRNHSF